MATTKERILVTLTPEMAHGLGICAKHEKSPRATVAARAIREWLEDEEDRELTRIVRERDVPGVKYLTHKEFWSRVEIRRS
ncbi:MAG: hypothetical protein Q8O94_04040 [bacterium]|nr:hypothetical protein [bacterium]